MWLWGALGQVAEGSEERLVLYLCAERLFVCSWQASYRGLGISIYLRNRVTQSDQIAARRFGIVTGTVSPKFCLIQP